MDLRRLVSRALVAGLCASALVAVIALLTGSFEDAHWRVIGSSLGFSIFTCTAAAGAALRSRSHAGLQALGTATIVASLSALVLLFAALWVEETDWLWRGFGIAGLGALWTSHAAIMLGALRPGDSPAVRALSQISAFTLGIETAVGIGALLDLITDVGDAAPRVLAALIVLTVLSTALAPILRRTQSTTAPSQAATAVGRASGFAAEVAESAQRLSLMDLPAPARAEVDHLRHLARDAGA